MSFSWNWLRIIIWIILIIYLIWIVYNIHIRKQRFIKHATQKLASHNFKITLVEVIICILAFGGMGYFNFINHARANEITINKDYKPLILDTNGKQSYYVQIGRTPSSQFRQYYSYLVKGERYQVLNNDSVITDNKNNFINPYSMYNLNNQQIKQLDSKYQNAWVGTITTTYKNNWINGIKGKAGKQARSHTLLRVPDQSFIYFNNHKYK